MELRAATASARRSGGSSSKARRCCASTGPIGCWSSATPTAGCRRSSRARLGIPVYHMEAGNRCYDDRVPEEINRRVIDHCSTVLMPYTERSTREPGARGHRAAPNLRHRQPDSRGARRPSADRIDAQRRAVAPRRARAGSTSSSRMHRAENVDVPERLRDAGRRTVVVADRLRIAPDCQRASAHRGEAGRVRHRRPHPSA